jgi:hypothetical protein
MGGAQRATLRSRSEDLNGQLFLASGASGIQSREAREEEQTGKGMGKRPKNKNQWDDTDRSKLALSSWRKGKIKKPLKKSTSAARAQGKQGLPLAFFTLLFIPTWEEPTTVFHFSFPLAKASKLRGLRGKKATLVERQIVFVVAIIIIIINLYSFSTSALDS